jgi:hypothetical protein
LTQKKKEKPLAKKKRGRPKGSLNKLKIEKREKRRMSEELPPEGVTVETAPTETPLPAEPLPADPPPATPPTEAQVEAPPDEQEIQLNTLLEIQDVTWNEGNVVKYVMRHRRRGGLADLEKAQMYLNRLRDQWLAAHKTG